MADNFDKFRPDWTVGTLTLTGGSTAFTATNAELILAAIREGDAIITPTGFFLPIETLADDGLTGTLSNPAPVAAAGTFDTRIRYQSDNSRFTGALLALTRQLTGGNLQSFGNLQGLQDLMPVFLGPGSVGLINKYDVGIQDPTGSLGKLATTTPDEDAIISFDNEGSLEFRNKDNAFPHGLTVGTSLHVEAEGASEIDFGVRGYGTGPVIHGYCAWGTKASPLSLGAGAMALGIGSRPFTGIDWAEHSTAALHFITREQVTPTNQGSSLRMLVTPLGADWSKRKEVLRLESDGETVGARIRGNFNGALGNRTYFQSIDSDGLSSSVGVVTGKSDPNAAAAFSAFGSADPANATYLMMQAFSTKTSIISASTGTVSAVPLYFNVGGADRAVIYQDGRIFINSSDILPSFSSSNYVNIRATPGSIAPLRLETNNATGTLAHFVTNAGLAGTIFSSGTSTTYNTSSDVQLKNDDGELSEEVALDILERVQIHSYRWKYDNSEDVGVFAQELFSIYPNAVFVGSGEPGDDNYVPWGVDYSKLVPILARCLQGIMRRVASLEGK